MRIASKKVRGATGRPASERLEGIDDLEGEEWGRSLVDAFLVLEFRLAVRDDAPAGLDGGLTVTN